MKKKFVIKKKPALPAKTKAGVPIPADWAMGKGRIKGTKNKFTSLKRAFVDVFDKLGGNKGLHDWANADPKNMSQFYTMLARMLPREVNIGTVDEVNPYNLENLADKELDTILKGVLKVTNRKKVKK